MWFAILVPSKSGNHIVHNYHTMVENDTLINQDSAHIIVFFCPFLVVKLANFKKCEYETT